MMAYIIGFQAWRWWTEERFPVVRQGVDWDAYNPFAPGDKLPHMEIPDELRLDQQNLPTMDGAFAVYLITARPRSENIRKIAEVLTSPVGQEMNRQVGYVPVSSNHPNHP